MASAPGGLIVIEPLDDIMRRYGDQLRQLGARKAKKVMVRAANHEGRKAYTAVKRTLRAQTSIPYAVIGAAMKFKAASTRGAVIETAIVGTGSHLTLKWFKPRQIKMGVSATVWGKRQKFKSAFGAPGSPAAGALRGVPYRRLGKARFPIKPLYGPNVAIEMVRDQTPQVFLVSAAKIGDRVAKEIAAVLRGY